MRVVTFLLLIFIMFGQLYAQEIRSDSLEIKRKIASYDAKHFKLDKKVWKAFRKHNFAYTSDYFKPNIVNVSDPNLLTDSAYVKAFRVVAHKKTTKRHTTGHYFLVGGGIYVVCTIVLIIVYASGGLRS